MLQVWQIFFDNQCFSISVADPCRLVHLEPSYHKCSLCPVNILLDNFWENFYSSVYILDLIHVLTLSGVLVAFFAYVALNLSFLYYIPSQKQMAERWQKPKWQKFQLKRTLKREFNSTWNRLEANGDQDRQVDHEDQLLLSLKLRLNSFISCSGWLRTAML